MRASRVTPRVRLLAEFVAEAIASVRDAVVIGGLPAAIIVLIVFLREPGVLTADGGVDACRIAAVATFVFMRVLGGSLNLMSLGGLAIAVGLVIDDAVVVVEAIHRALAAGMTPKDAAAAGTGASWPARRSRSTLTTVVVFAPLGAALGRAWAVLHARWR